MPAASGGSGAGSAIGRLKQTRNVSHLPYSDLQPHLALRITDKRASRAQCAGGEVHVGFPRSA